MKSKGTTKASPAVDEIQILIIMTSPQNIERQRVMFCGHQKFELYQQPEALAAPI